MTGTNSSASSTTAVPSSSASTTTTRRPPRATPPTQPLPPVPTRPQLTTSHSSPPRIPSNLSPYASSRKETSSPRLGPSPLTKPSLRTTPSRPELRQTASSDARTRSLTCSQPAAPPSQQQRVRDVARTRGTSDAPYRRSPDFAQLPPGARAPVNPSAPITIKNPLPPPSAFPASSPPLSSFHPFADDDGARETANNDHSTTTSTSSNTNTNMATDNSRRSPTPQASRFHHPVSHSSKLLSKIRAKASVHSLRSSSSAPDSASSPRTSEETLTELFFDDETTPTTSSITAAIRQRARTLSRSSPKSRLSKNFDASQPLAMVRFPEEEDSPTDVEEEEEEDKSPTSPEGYQRPATFQLQDVVLRNGMRVAPQPVWEVPYPVGYSCAALQSDDKTYDLVKALMPDRSSPSFHHFRHAPSMVLDLGCGVGRWVIEAAQEWTKSRFFGVDLMDLQPDLAEKGYEEIRDRVQWVHRNFLQFKLPFPDAHFDFIRMSFIALAVPDSKWRFLVKEIRRVLKPSGVLEWIDEDPMLPISPSYSPSSPSTLQNAHHLHTSFTDLLRARRLDGAVRAFRDELKALKGLFEMSPPRFEWRFKVALPGPSTELTSRSGFEGSLIRGASGSPLGRTSIKRREGEERERTSVRRREGEERERVSVDVNEKTLPAIPLPYYLPQGLVVLSERTDERGNKYRENNLLPLSAEDIEAHAGRGAQLVLNAREAIWAHRQRVAEKSGEYEAVRERLDEQLWEYECERWARLHLPLQTWYDSDDDFQPPSGSRIYRRKSPRPASMTVMMPPAGEKPTVVRSIFVMTCKSL